MNQKEQFTENEIFASAVRGAFLRVREKIYSPDATSEQRELIKCRAKKYLGEIKERYASKNSVSSEQHTNEISLLKAKLDGDGFKILQKEQITFGVTQKLLNLYLKYFWCMRVIEEPPHCPVDSIVLKEIGMSNLRWPSMNESEYVRAIKEIQEAAEGKSLTIAEWELHLFNEKNPTYQCIEKLDRENTKKNLHHD